MNNLYVVGIGPGDYESMTIRAERTLRQCDVIIGYTVYIGLIEQHFPDKEFLSTPMRHEKERCELAFQKAMEGKQAALVCSGDSGVYGMSGLVLEIGRNYPKVEIMMVPGVTAALSGGAVLGAPLVHDFAVISLSDLLTPWETIEKRLAAAADGDFSVCLYNPASKKRADYLQKACEILLRKKAPETVCGAVHNIGRDGEKAVIMTLAELKDYKADMFTTVFVGNSQTVRVKENGNDRIVTPRGYRL